jgi:hypothetical protein
MRRNLTLALALGLAAFAGKASAETCVGVADAGECPIDIPSLVNANTEWCGAANPGPIILNEPVFVTGGATLTIRPGCVIMGQPRQAAVVMGVTAGTPGALIVTQTGRINAQGTADDPIILTTAAVDAAENGGNGNGQADNVDGNPGFLDPYPGGAAINAEGAPVTALDDNPFTSPLSPLNTAGVQNVSLWGGMVILGNAPTNISNFNGQGHGEMLVEGLTVPGFPDANARYGGVHPHDRSGVMRYLSIRHAGDEIGNSNELNCLTLGGVGDGTDISFVDCYANFDDGIEIFGGTVDTHHMVASYVGDDLFDLDQGHTGVHQFWLAVQGNFNQNSGVIFGQAGADKGCECDGDDHVFAPGTPLLHNLSTRFQVASNPAPAAAVENTPWPLSEPLIFNMTVVGPAADGAANPASSPLSDANLDGKRGIDMRNGFAGRLINSMIVNYDNGGAGNGLGLDVRNGDGGAPGFDTETNNVAVLPGSEGGPLVAVVTSTFDDVAAMGAAENTALANGDAIRVAFGAPNNASSLNCVNNAVFAGLAQENNLIDPDAGNLGPSADGPIDPDPLFGSCGLNGVPPYGRAGDGSATYRGAFQAGEPNWTTGWSTLNLGGVLEDF